MKSTILKTLLLASAFSVAGFAEAVTISVPFPFSAAGRSLPAGEYTFHEDSAGVMIVTGSAPRSSMLMLTRGIDAAASDKSGATFSESKALKCIQMPDGKKLEVIGSSK